MVVPRNGEMSSSCQYQSLGNNNSTSCFNDSMCTKETDVYVNTVNYVGLQSTSKVDDNMNKRDTAITR